MWFEIICMLLNVVDNFSVVVVSSVEKGSVVFVDVGLIIFDFSF